MLAFCQWVGLPQPLYIFNSYTTQQLFHMNALSDGTLAVYYNNRLAAAAGKLNVEQLTTRLQNGTNYAGLDIRHASSSVSGFRYVYLAEPQRIFTPALLWMFGVGLAALAASLGIMGLITARMYQPIRGVLMTTGQFTAGDEMAHIRDTIVNLHTDVEEMAQALAQHKAAQESSVLHDLLTGVIPPNRLGRRWGHFPSFRRKDFWCSSCCGTHPPLRLPEASITASPVRPDSGWPMPCSSILRPAPFSVWWR